MASAASAGLGDHDIAAATGFAAVASNPAGLALGPGGLNGALLPFRGGVGLQPVTLGELADWNGERVPREVREEWLRRIAREGGERGSAVARVTPIALARGSLGVQLSTVAAGRAELNPDAAELILFGNAGRGDGGRGFELAGSRLDGWAVSTLAVAHGRTLGDVRGGRLHVGATVKVVVGHGLLVARDAGSTLVGDPLDVALAFPVLSPASGSGLDHGRGVGLDLGALWERESATWALVLRNVPNTFGWDLDGLAFRPGTALVDESDGTSDFDERPASAAPRALKDPAREMRFGPEIEVGASRRTAGGLLLVASAGLRFGDVLVERPGAWAGAGVEGRVRDFLPVRAHLGVREDGFVVGWGATVEWGPLRLGGAASLAVGGLEDASRGAFSLSWRGG